MSEEQTVNVAGDANPEATLAGFATIIRAGLGDLVAEERGPVGGYEWTWNRRGVWVLRAGELLTVEPHLVGPAGRWQFGAAALTNPDLVLLFLRLSDALPEHAPAFRNAGRVYGRSQPVAAAGRPGSTPVLLRRDGRVGDGLHRLVTPDGQPVVVSDRGGDLVRVLPDGRMGSLSVPPFGHLPPEEGVPALLHDQPGVLDCEMLDGTTVRTPIAAGLDAIPAFVGAAAAGLDSLAGLAADVRSVAAGWQPGTAVTDYVGAAQKSAAGGEVGGVRDPGGAAAVGPAPAAAGPDPAPPVAAPVGGVVPGA